jgi:two-component system KDP operon response regulator KdpE
VSLVRALAVVIEDDPKLRRLLRASLEEAGLEVREAASGGSGLDAAAARPPDLIILDLGLPDIDGVEIIRRLRSWWLGHPLIVLSGRDNEATKVLALEAGADDYVTKPFAAGELLARVRAALRRGARTRDPRHGALYVAQGVTIDLQTREVRRAARNVALTHNEYRVLAVLAEHAGLLVSNERLVGELWGPEPRANSRHYLRSYISSLRHKLEDDPARPSLILTEAGVGYRLAQALG